LPGLHPGGKGSVVLIHPADAAPLGINDGDLVRVYSPGGEVEVTALLSDRPRPGVVVMDHGWGSRVFDPHGGSAPQSFGANRNLLIAGEPVDPLSQTPAMSSSYVGIARSGPERRGDAFQDRRFRRTRLNGTPRSAAYSRGKFKTRSPITLRAISVVPPPMLAI